jgi:hypothetical protein
VLGYSPEYRQLEGDPHLLGAIAELTGGRDLTPFFEDGDFEAVLTHDLPAGVASRPIWPWLLTLVVFLLPVDIAMRRVVVTSADARRLWRRTVGRVWRPTAPVAARSERVTRLFQAKERARRPQDEAKSDEQSAAAAEQVEPLSLEPAETAPGKAVASDSTEADSRAGAEEDFGSLASRLLERRRRNDQDSSGDGD